MADNLYLSDKAYEHLIYMAKQGGFIRQNAVNMVGLSKFLNKLSFCDFKDTRPEEVIQRHEEELAKEFIPEYNDPGHFKVSRYLTLDNETYANYFEVALRFGIYIVNRQLTYRKIKSTLAVVGNTLEAIGLEYITPTSIPIRTANDSRQNSSISELTSGRRSAVHRLSKENPYYYWLSPRRKEKVT